MKRGGVVMNHVGPGMLAGRAGMKSRGTGTSDLGNGMCKGGWAEKMSGWHEKG